jgi:hypothetical protein
LNDLHQFSSTLNLQSIVFGLTPFGWLRSITLTLTHISDGNMLFYLRPLFHEQKMGEKEGLGTTRKIHKNKRQGRRYC